MSADKLTKAEIVDEIHAALVGKFSGLNKREVHAVLDVFFTEIKDGLALGKAVELRGFGTFQLRKRKGKERARNPRTGETLPVEGHSVAVFRPGRELRERVWGVEIL